MLCILCIVTRFKNVSDVDDIQNKISYFKMCIITNVVFIILLCSEYKTEYNFLFYIYIYIYIFNIYHIYLYRSITSK